MPATLSCSDALNTYGALFLIIEDTEVGGTVTQGSSRALDVMVLSRPKHINSRQCLGVLCAGSKHSVMAGGVQDWLHTCCMAAGRLPSRRA